MSPPFALFLLATTALCWHTFIRLRRAEFPLVGAIGAVIFAAGLATLLFGGFEIFPDFFYSLAGLSVTVIAIVAGFLAIVAGAFQLARAQAAKNATDNSG